MKLPRNWPVLLAIDQLGTLHSNFRLQKLVFLCKAEGKLPIEYNFTKHDFGPYDRTIKNDAITLGTMGLAEVRRNGSWHFQVTTSGKKRAENIRKQLKPVYRRRFEEILKKYAAMSVFDLSSYVYKKFIHTQDESELAKRELLRQAKACLEEFAVFPPNRNVMFVRASLAYSVEVLERERIKDVAQKGFLLGLFNDFVEDIGKLFDQCKNNPEVLAELDIADLKDTFDEVIQESCAQLKIGDRLNTEDEAREVSPIAVPA